jgi:pimeloyl-ACP methyl ester carboxylesterase
MTCVPPGDLASALREVVLETAQILETEQRVQIVQAHHLFDAGRGRAVALQFPRRHRARAVWSKYLVIYRTCADPAYLDLTIDPDDRPMGCVFAYPDPLDSNYRRHGLARTMTARGWLSTWSALSSKARLTDSLPNVDVPTLFVHATADTEVRMREVTETFDSAAASDMTITYLKGVAHTMKGHRQQVLSGVTSWARERFPTPS